MRNPSPELEGESKAGAGDSAPTRDHVRRGQTVERHVDLDGAELPGEERQPFSLFQPPGVEAALRPVGVAPAARPDVAAFWRHGRIIPRRFAMYQAAGLPAA